MVLIPGGLYDTNKRMRLPGSSLPSQSLAVSGIEETQQSTLAQKFLQVGLSVSHLPIPDSPS